jgi:hypothetical protein
VWKTKARRTAENSGEVRAGWYLRNLASLGAEDSRNLRD